nr:tryptophan synthase subunit alpha [Alpinimonas psychrophila]
MKRRVKQARAEQRGLLVGFLPAGYPTPAAFTAAAHAAFSAGLDVLEVSMPGPAPALDGPLIQAAASQISRGITTVAEALKLAAESRNSPDDTIVALAYASTFDTMTVEDFIDALHLADIDALLLPQHPVSEQLRIGLLAKSVGIEPFIFLHLEEDLSKLAATDIEEPVIYLQSSDLQTGGEFNSAKALERLDELAAAFGEKPYAVCVGFGVRGFSEAQTLMSAGADGVIIGTRLVAAVAIDIDSVVAIVDEVAPALVRRLAVDA